MPVILRSILFQFLADAITENIHTAGTTQPEFHSSSTLKSAPADVHTHPHLAILLRRERRFNRRTRHLPIEAGAKLISQRLHDRSDLVDAGCNLRRDGSVQVFYRHCGGQIAFQHFRLRLILRDQVVALAAPREIQRLVAARPLALDNLDDLVLVSVAADVLLQPRYFRKNATHGHQPQLVAAFHSGLEVALQFFLHTLLRPFQSDYFTGTGANKGLARANLRPARSLADYQSIPGTARAW